MLIHMVRTLLLRRGRARTNCSPPGREQTEGRQAVRRGTGRNQLIALPSGCTFKAPAAMGHSCISANVTVPEAAFFTTALTELEGEREAHPACQKMGGLKKGLKDTLAEKGGTGRGKSSAQRSEGKGVCRQEGSEVERWGSSDSEQGTCCQCCQVARPTAGVTMPCRGLAAARGHCRLGAAVSCARRAP